MSHRVSRDQCVQVVLRMFLLTKFNQSFYNVSQRFVFICTFLISERLLFGLLLQHK